LLDTLYSTKHKYYKNREKLISLTYSEAVCTIQEGCTASGTKKKLDELKNKYLSEKN
jgi:hypothetical protein